MHFADPHGTVLPRGFVQTNLPWTWLVLQPGAAQASFCSCLKLGPVLVAQPPGLCLDGAAFDRTWLPIVAGSPLALTLLEAATHKMGGANRSAQWLNSAVAVRLHLVNCRKHLLHFCIPPLQPPPASPLLAVVASSPAVQFIKTLRYSNVSLSHHGTVVGGNGCIVQLDPHPGSGSMLSVRPIQTKSC